jgi:hypothetical protein
MRRAGRTVEMPRQNLSYRESNLFHLCGMWSHLSIQRRIACIMIASSSVPFQTLRAFQRNLYRSAPYCRRSSTGHSLEVFWDSRKQKQTFCIVSSMYKQYPWGSLMIGASRRHMSQRAELPFHNRRPVIPKLPINMCKVEFCHSSYDLEEYAHRLRNVDEYEDRDDSLHRGIFKLRWDIHSIFKMANAYYAEKTNKKLEYFGYVSKTWKRLIDLESDGQDVTYYQGKGGRPMPIRIRSRFKEEDLSDSDEPNPPEEINRWVELLEGETMREAVRDLVKRLKACNYRRVSTTEIASPHIGNNVPIATTEWITEQASIDESLARLLINRPGALQHIAYCIYQFDSLWLDMGRFEQ